MQILTMGGFIFQETGGYQLIFAFTLYRTWSRAFTLIRVFAMQPRIDGGEQPHWTVVAGRIREDARDCSERDVIPVSKGARDA